jgi:hypothetical protein
MPRLLRDTLSQVLMTGNGIVSYKCMPCNVLRIKNLIGTAIAKSVSEDYIQWQKF